MGTATQVLTTQNQQIINYDYSKLFLTNFKVISVNVAASGADIELTPGVLMGRISATGKGAICKSGSSDGSQVPLGLCVETKTIADGENADVQIAVTGRVDETKIVLDGTDTLDTAFDGRILRDRIPADTEGIELETLTDLVNTDNQ
jgi:hypothetical protein